MDDFIEVYDNALSPAFCQKMIAAFDQSPHLMQGRAGGIIDPNKKLSLDLHLNDHPEYADLLEHITQVTAKYVCAYFEKYRFALIAPIALTLLHPKTEQPVALTHDNYDELAEGRTEHLMKALYRLGKIQAQKYQQGSGNYNYWHCEVFPMAPHNEQLHRSLLFMFYLNDVIEGGQTEFYYQQKSITPRAGTMVVAPAYFTHTHRGRIPLSGDKYILTSWVMLQRAENIYKTQA